MFVTWFTAKDKYKKKGVKKRYYKIVEKNRSLNLTENIRAHRIYKIHFSQTANPIGFGLIFYTRGLYSKNRDQIKWLFR